MVVKIWKKILILLKTLIGFWNDFVVVPVWFWSYNEYKGQVAQACEKCFSPEFHAKQR